MAGPSVDAPPLACDPKLAGLHRVHVGVGNGDGIFTVEEQELSFGQDWEAWRGRYLLVDSNQNLRLGFRIAF